MNEYRAAIAALSERPPSQVNLNKGSKVLSRRMEKRVSSIQTPPSNTVGAVSLVEVVKKNPGISSTSDIIGNLYGATLTIHVKLKGNIPQSRKKSSPARVLK